MMVESLCEGSLWANEKRSFQPSSPLFWGTIAPCGWPCNGKVLLNWILSMRFLFVSTMLIGAESTKRILSSLTRIIPGQKIEPRKSRSERYITSSFRLTWIPANTNFV